MREPTTTEIQRAGWSWCNDKNRETGFDDVEYFCGNWRHQPGLRAYVERQVAKNDRLSSLNSQEGKDA